MMAEHCNEISGLSVAYDVDAEEVIDDLAEAVRETFDSQYHGLPEALLLYILLVDQGWAPPKGQATIVRHSKAGATNGSEEIFPKRP